MGHKLIEELGNGTKSMLTQKRILTYLMHNHSSTIPDLAKDIDLSIPTVTKFVMELVDEGYIINYGKQETSEGRPPNLYGLNPDSAYMVGVDIKAFCLNIGLMNFTGDMVDIQMGIECHLDNTLESLDVLIHHISTFIEKHQNVREKILQVGVNISGRVNPEEGYSFSMFNFEERPLAEILTEKIGIPVSIDNDTRAMAYGELLKGVVKGEKDVVFISAGDLVRPLSLTEKSIRDVRVSRENSVISMCSTMKSSAAAGKKDVWKPRFPVRRCIEFFVSG